MLSRPGLTRPPIFEIDLMDGRLHDRIKSGHPSVHDKAEWIYPLTPQATTTPQMSRTNSATNAIPEIKKPVLRLLASAV